MTVIGNTVVLVFEEAKIAHQSLLEKATKKVNK
jgi:hypothetical protein